MFNNIPKDKLLHFIAGVVVYLIANVFTDPFNAVAISVLIGALKEIYDSFDSKRTPDVFDFIATCLGGISGFLISYF